MEVTRSDLSTFAKEFVATLPKETGTGAYVVGLSGELGAGKTAFVQEVAKVLGVTEAVTSPTFIIVRTHAIDHPPFKRLVHIDAYRLEKSDAGTIGWDDYMHNSENLILMEWPERLPGAPEFDARLAFSVVSEQVRDIEKVPV
ncbi:MAG: tRNA (adenosine(37)-N6)-threonylcarbamoyltransferase complex ATPase subunit type 1 TsaE [Patescibacteria group bacterium]